ncbi:hypothetical protein DITRI_Ditri04bG0159600 [Diplodiscus trichospermus]
MARTLESKLYEAAEQGSVAILLELIQQDRLILDRVLVNYTTDQTPLHVAAMLGHTDFVKEIIHRKPEFTRELSDSWGSSPLHLASAKGYVEIVKPLLFVNPDMCLARDTELRNALHLAAMMGQIDVLKELVDARPQAAKVTVDWGQTILHLCVKCGQFESLNLLIEVIDDHEFLNATDDDGMTILHLAVAFKQIEIIKYLLSNTSVEVNALNANGFTALDVLAQSRRGLKDFDIAESLWDAGALKAQIPMTAPSKECHKVQKTSNKEDWLTRKRDSLMVVASLIATMAFQAALTPPGGLWQIVNNSTEPHEAGTSIIADKDQRNYTLYLSFNTTSFVASLSIILFLITGLPFKRRFFMWILTVIVWIAISSMALTYRISLVVFTTKAQKLNVTGVLEFALTVWSGVMALLLTGNNIRLASSVFKKVVNVLGKKR